MHKSLQLIALALVLVLFIFNSCEQNIAASGDKDIYSFKIVNLNPIIEADVDNESFIISFKLPYNVLADSLTFEIEVAQGASSEPESGSIINFTETDVITIIAEDGTSQEFSIIVNTTKADFVYDFEDLSLEANSFWSGPDTSVDAEIVNLFGFDCDVYYGSFLDKNAEFSNAYNATWLSWSGFAYSNMIDVETASYLNQYSVYDTYGANESVNFAVAYAPLSATPVTNIEFDTLVAPQSVYINNSTYTYFSMLNGDDYTKPFSEGDYLQLEIEGFDKAGNSTGIVEFYLADFQNGKSEILSDWELVNLSKLGDVQKLEFKLKASQTGVPTYFCMDNLEALRN